MCVCLSLCVCACVCAQCIGGKGVCARWVAGNPPCNYSAGARLFVSWEKAALWGSGRIVCIAVGRQD